MNRFYLSLFFIIIAMFFITSCELFEPGLGDKVDINPPFLFVSSHSNGEYVSGIVTLSGNFEEDKETSRVQVSVDGGVTFIDAALNNKKKTWSCEVDTTAYLDGEKDVVFIITDSSGKTTQKNILLYFDNTPPLIVVNVPLVYGGDASYYGTVAIKGEAADTFGIKNITITLQDLTQEVADGRNSWSYYFDSISYVPAQGSYSFSITAEDNAGNTSTDFYHYADVKTANSGDAMSIEDLFKIYSGEVSNPTMEDFLANEGKTSISYNFDQDLDKPTIEIYNPSEDSIPEENVVSGNARLSGKIIDENGVKAGSTEIYIIKDGESVPEVDWEGADETNPGTESVSWSYILDGLADGQYSLRVRAEDENGNQRTTDPAVGFIVDSGAPTITVEQPTQGAYINGNFTISGTAVDLQGIEQVEVSLDDGDTYELATLIGDDWSYNVTDPDEGSILIKVKATEDTIEKKKAYYNLQVIVDRTLPEITFLNPQYSSTVNGLVLIKGVSSDNTQITDVKLRIGESPSQLTMTNKYNWEYEIDSQSYADDEYAEEEPGSPGVWRLYVTAQVTDKAGNVRTKDDYYFLIDNDMDKPNVTILSPQEGANIGGSTLVTGTAFDDDSLYGVYMSIDLDNDGFFTHQYDLNGDLDTGYLDGTIVDLPIGNTGDRFEDETKWYPVEDGIITWKQTLNSDGELYHVTGGHNGDITVRVVAVDTKDGGISPSVKGNARVLSFRFDDTIPGFESLNHSSGSYVKGEFHLTGRVTDDTRVDKLDISYDGGLSWSSVATPYLATYDFDITVDTETINSGEFDDSSGILYLRLRAEDNTGFRKLQLIDFNVDNSYPENTAYTGASSDIHGSSVYALMQGEAEDSGAVSGIKEIHVYFIRGGLVFNPKVYDSSTAIGTFDFGDGNGNVPYTSNTTYKIVIDDKNEFGNDTGPNGDNDGYPESLSLSGSTMNWWATFTSANIPDGEIDIHYVIFDNALNGTHYSFTGCIKNYKPQINGITVGSDVDFSNTVDGDEQSTYNNTIYSSGNRFKARNRFYLEIDAEDTGGTIPGIADYEFFHETTSLQSGSSPVLDISLSSYSDQDTYFTCMITDNDDIEVTTMTVWVTFDKDDEEDPVIVIDDLDTDDDGDPSEHIVDGHIELPGNSVYDNSPQDADVSGTILMTGSASDNHRISTISLTLDGTGSGLVIAEWVGNMLQPADLDIDGFRDDENFKILTQSLTASDGHEITWSYTWDTTTVTNAAGPDIRATFAVNDPYANSSNSYCDYDVVPYISSISNASGYGLSIDVLRSSTGKYSIDYDLNSNPSNYFIVSGYNLGGPNNVRISSAPITSPSGLDITGNITGTPTQTQLRIRKQITRSGYLTVFINGVPTLNNMNADTDNNLESEVNMPRTTQWKDDRYLHVWDTTEVMSSVGNQTFYYPDMYMAGDQPIFSYCNDNNGYTYITTGDSASTSLVGRWFERQTAIARNSDNTYYIVSSEDAFSGNAIGYLQLNYNNKQGGARIDDSYAGVNGVIELAGSDWDGTVNGGSGDSRQLNRFKYPNIIVEGTDSATQVYISYYDSHPAREQIQFFSFQTTGDTSDNLNEPTRDYRIASNGNLAIPGTSGNSSAYTAMTKIGGDIAIAYYDQTASNLKIRYSSNHTSGNLSNSGATWTQLVVDSTPFCGSYVSVTNDGTYVYLAYYDGGNANLKFARITWATKAVAVYTIDAYLAVGTWTDITVIDGIAFLSYYSDSYNGTKYPLRVAYPTTSMASLDHGVLGGGTSEAYSGNWEIMAIPAFTPPKGGMEQFNHTNIDEYTNNGLDLPVVGWLSNHIEYSKLMPNN
ncbi:MAG: Ig-like domain repeat protein [Spirochaetales bacterium]|nr:Ig-like domain repeat protein [Spirochaetales bacterium]